MIPIDSEPLISLASRQPERHLHLIDLPYRLSSWALDRPENLRVWRDAGGAPSAWAVVQSPFWAIDIVADASSGLYAEALAWAVERAQALCGDPDQGRPCWFVSVLDGEEAEIRALTAAGFADQTDVSQDPWSKVLLSRPALGVAEVEPPEGYRVRPLLGDAEVPAYVALHQAVFESKNMTEAWRTRTLRHQRYRPELDLVVEAPDGTLAGFCIGWFAPEGRAGRPGGQIEPLGVSATHRGLGLSQALLGACCARLARLGAERVSVETDNQRDAALAAYEAAGFRRERFVRVFRRDMC